MTLAIDAEQSLLSRVDAALASGIRLKHWWERADARNSFTDRIELMRSFNPPGGSYGFFETVPLDQGALPVMGVSQWMAFDTTKAGAPTRTRDELREFVLRYFMRVSSFQEPEPYVHSRRPPTRLAGVLSWCPRNESARVGFGYSQLYYKLAGTGEVRRFPSQAEYEFVDLREIGPTYEWILAKVQLHSFILNFSPFGVSGPALALPLNESQYLLLSRDFIVDDSAATTNTLGRYCLGYALLKNPPPQGLLGYGPGEFSAGFEFIEFVVEPDGSSRVRMSFLVDQPQRIFNLPIDPLTTFIDLANVLSGGMAARAFCISMRTLSTDFLIQHFHQNFVMMSGALTTWSQVANWLDTPSIPRWMQRGVVE